MTFIVMDIYLEEREREPKSQSQSQSTRARARLYKPCHIMSRNFLRTPLNDVLNWAEDEKEIEEGKKKKRGRR